MFIFLGLLLTLSLSFIFGQERLSRRHQERMAEFYRPRPGLDAAARSRPRR